MRHKSVTSRGESFVALGANLPGPEGAPDVTLRHAISRISDSGLTIARASRFFSTPCYPPGAGPDYVNAVVAVRGSAEPDTLLSVLHDIEAEAGRERRQRWGSRVLDLDLIAMGDRICPDRETFLRWAGLDPALQRRAAPERLILPHPRIQDRAFVLIPLLDIAPDWRHPVYGRRARELAAALPETDTRAVKPL